MKRQPLFGTGLEKQCAWGFAYSM